MTCSGRKGPGAEADPTCGNGAGCVVFCFFTRGQSSRFMLGGQAFVARPRVCARGQFWPIAFIYLTYDVFGPQRHLTVRDLAMASLDAFLCDLHPAISFHSGLGVECACQVVL